MAAGGGDPWKISGEERAKHDAQFFSLKPVNGYVTGGQARDFFMQSGLSTQVLGQIWGLADMNNDGKMDKLEFSVAMHLIKKKLQGYELPKVLPAILKAAPSPVIGTFGMQAGPMAMGQQVVMGMAPAMNPPMGMPVASSMLPQASLGTSTMTTGSVGMPLMANGMGPAQGMGMGMPPAQPANMASSGWSMPHPTRLKYTQLFNSHDRNKRGFLTGVEARAILMSSGLPQPLLAQIWALSDVDGDGKLTCDEFCIAMHLVDMARLGRALPQKLPPELIPTKTRSGSFGPAGGMPGAMPAGIAPPPQAAPQQKDSFGDLLSGVGMGMPQPLPAQAPQLAAEEPEDLCMATFEDKRKENFDKGQAELERRRAALQEQLKAEENARLEKERREAEKRERIRLEQEAKRQEELHRQLEKQRKIEMERDEQRRKMMEQREQARRELERQRQMEWERQRKEQLMSEKQREFEQLSSLKSQSTNFKGQLESLDGKKAELTQKVAQVRNGITEFTSAIESMRVQRDTTIADIDRAERETTELNQKLARLNGEKEKLQMQIQTQQNTPISDAHRTVMHSVELKKTNIQKLRRELEQLEQETETKLVDIDNGNIQVKSLQSLVDQLQKEIPTLQKNQQDTKRKQDMEKANKDKQQKEQLKKELEMQRKKEDAATPKINVNGSNTQQGSWFDFNSSGAAPAAKAGDGDAWGNAFAPTAAAVTTGGTSDVWGSSDPFASQSAAGGGGVKKTPYKALFPFESRSEDELNINTGDDILVWDVPSEPGMEEWFKGEANGSVGWFPQAYAEPVPEPQPSAFTSQKETSDVFGSAFQPVKQTASHASPVPAPSASVNTGAVKPAGPPVAESSFQPTPGEAHQAPEGLQAQALYQWKARQDNHLSFNKDDIITVREQEDMWWHGDLAGKDGWFPKAYVKLLEQEKASLGSSQTSSPMGTLEKSGSARASPTPERRDGEYYVATYSYVSGEPTDLSFNEGDMILVSKKEDDWWTGTLGEKTGMFPASYVKRVEIQPSGTTSTTDHAGATFRSDNFGGGVDYTLGENASWENPSGMGKPVAPPRRTRSKKGSESEASFIQSADWVGQGSGTADFGADFGQAFAPNPEATTMKAPPRRSRSKKGSEPESAAGKQASTVPENGQGLFDFGADFADAFPPQVPEEAPFQNSGAAGDAFDFGADFTDAFPPHMPDETTATGSPAGAFGLGADFADAFPPLGPEGNLQAAEKSSTEFDFGSDFTSPFSLQAPENTNQPFSTDPQNSAAAGISFGDDQFKATGSTATTTGEKINASDGTPDFGTAFSDPFPDLNSALGSGDNMFNSQSASDQFANVDFSNSFSPPDPTLAVHDTAAFPAQSAPSSGGQDRTTTPQPQAFSEDATDPSSRSQVPTVQSDFAVSVSTSQIPSTSNRTSNLAAVFSDSALATMGTEKADGITLGKTGAGLSAAQQATKSTSSGNLFDLDFVGLMSTASPVPFNKSLENVRPLDTGSPVNVNSPVPFNKALENTRSLNTGSPVNVNSPVPFNKALENTRSLNTGSPVNTSSPVPAKFYMGETTLSASSSSAELTALADMNQPATAELTDLAPQNPSLALPTAFSAGGENPSGPSPNPFATDGENLTKASPNPFASGGENLFLTQGSPNFFATGGENYSKVLPSPFAADRENPSQPSPNPFAAGAGSMDPFADLFNDHADTTTSVSFALDPLQSATESVGGSSPFCLAGAGGGSEPTELPPPLPPKASLEIPPDVPPRTTSLHAPESVQGETTAESDEPGHKTLKKPEIAMVIAPYTASGNGQLSLEAGNLINVRQKSPRGWWEGELQARGQRKKIGWFPANYVKLLGSSSARSTPDPNATLSAGGSQHSGGSRSSTPQPQPTTAAPPLPTPQAERLVALYPYVAQNEDELSFEKDAVITVISRDNPDWWQGEVSGQTGLFPSNYVTPLDAAQHSWLSDSVRHKLTGAEKQRQNYIQELITTEETYNDDMSIVLEAFRNPLLEAGVLTEQESDKIFVNWNDLIICNKKFLQALRVRKKMCGKGKVIFMIGDILCENLPHMTSYVRFCSCQLTAASLLQSKTENNPQFVEVHKKCVTNPAAKGMPLSSFLLKPMQRITKYPLLIKEILKHTPSDHADYGNLEDALQKAEELCSQVNEGVREKENSDRLEWIQQHVHCDGLAENITFNSVTNCLGPRRLLHCGVVYKVKSNKELLAFLFNDFLLLTIPPRVLGHSMSTSHIFDSKSRDQYKMYKTPIVLNEVMVKKHADADGDSCQFQVSHIERVYHLRAPNESERDLWVKRLESASRNFLDTDRRKRERAHSLKCKPVGRLLVILEEGIRLRSASDSARRVPGVGRLLVVILEGCDLRASDSDGKSDPYCEVSMGSQEHRTRVVNNSLNPKWNASMQFTIRDLRQDVLCITVYDRDLYSPNDFLGRTEVRMSEVMEEAKVKKGPITKRLILHEVDTGEVVVKLDLQLYES